MTLLREAARPAAVREHRLAPWFAVGTVCFGAFMGQLDASVVTVAFPAMQRQFGAGLAEVQWVSLAYLLALIALLVPVGRLSDRFGRKLTYLYGFLLFAGASAACGMAGSMRVMIALRLLQAAGAAMLQANSVALVATSTPAPMRRAALGIQAAAQALGLACGPVAGGILVASVGWRWIFLINVPVGLIAVVAGRFLLPRSRGLASGRGVDPAGTLLLAAASAGVMLVISSLSGLGLRPWALAGCVAIAAATGVGLLWRDRRAATPLLNIAMLKAAGVLPALGGALCVYLTLFGPLVLFPQVLSVQGGGALRTGLSLSALPAGFGLAAVIGERLLPVGWSNRRRCVGGGALAFGCAAALAVPAPLAVSVLLLGLLGVGLGVYTPANNAEIMTAVPAQQAATAGGMVNMTRGFGTALGVAVVTLGLHAGDRIGDPADGPTLAFVALAAAAFAAAWAGRRASRSVHAVLTEDPRADLR
jgi:MFS family permease